MDDKLSTLNRAELADRIHLNVGLSGVRSRLILDRIIDHLNTALARGEEVKITNFGTFRLLDKAARMGRNPKTSVEAEVTARRVVSFRASGKLKDKVAPPSSHALPTNTSLDPCPSCTLSHALVDECSS